MEILNDFSTSVHKALEEIDPRYMDYDGLVICGTHAPHNTEMMIKKIQEARENKRPFYSECFGHQLACIEWARNIMGIKDATSEEFGTGTLVVKKRPKMKVGFQDGESWWSNYEVIAGVEEDFVKRRPSYFFTAPFHPSYQSSIKKPHPLLVSFLEVCRQRQSV